MQMEVKASVKKAMQQVKSYFPGHLLSKLEQISRGVDGVANVVTVSGYSLLTGAVQPNSGLGLIILGECQKRASLAHTS